MTRWLHRAGRRLARPWRVERAADDDAIVFRAFARNLRGVLAARLAGARERDRRTSRACA